jgi:hypothetical protein
MIYFPLLALFTEMPRKVEFSEVPHRPDPMRQNFLCRVSRIQSPAYIRQFGSGSTTTNSR